MFACAHPAIDPAMRSPLMLQTVLGLDAATIAAVFLVPPATMGQRLVRAKRRIRDAGIPFRLPEPADLPARLDAVLEAIYAAFAAGWADPAGLDQRRQGLVEEALWLGRAAGGAAAGRAGGAGIAGADAPRRGAVGGAARRRRAATCRCRRRTRRAGMRRRSRRRRLCCCGPARCGASAGSSSRRRCSRRMPRGGATGRTDWPAIVELYDGLLALTGSPVVAVNRAVALAETDGAAAGLAALDALAADAELAAIPAISGRRAPICWPGWGGGPRPMPPTPMLWRWNPIRRRGSSWQSAARGCCPCAGDAGGGGDAGPARPTLAAWRGNPTEAAWTAGQSD